MESNRPPQILTCENVNLEAIAVFNYESVKNKSPLNVSEETAELQCIFFCNESGDRFILKDWIKCQFVVIK